MVSHCWTFICCHCGEPVPLPVGSSGQSVLCSHCLHRYVLDRGILIIQPPEHQDDYPEEGYDVLADVEPAHFWFRGRNSLIDSTMREVLGPLAGRTVLDIGCGTGFVLASLERAGMIGCGMDMHLSGLKYARKRTQGPLLCDPTRRVPFSEQFDVVMLCDVIEHAIDDAEVLRRASQALKPGGALVVTVPAYPFLWTTVDEVSGHKRRYTRQTLVNTLELADLELRLARYFNILVLPLQLLHRVLLCRPGSGRTRERLLRETVRVPPPPLNHLLRLIVAADIPLGRLGAPFGASLIAIARRL